MSQLRVQPAVLASVLYLADGYTTVSRGAGDPAPVEFDDLTAHLILAFTPNATTVTIAYDAGAAILTNVGSLRVENCQGAEFVTIRHFRAWARRKPGTSGAITAQVIAFKGWNGSALEEVARINIKAETAGADPECDFVELTKVAGDSRFYFQADHPFNVVFATADTDLEVVIEAYGYDA